MRAPQPAMMATPTAKIADLFFRYWFGGPAGAVAGRGAWAAEVAGKGGCGGGRRGLLLAGVGVDGVGVGGGGAMSGGGCHGRQGLIDQRGSLRRRCLIGWSMVNARVRENGCGIEIDSRQGDEADYCSQPCLN